MALGPHVGAIVVMRVPPHWVPPKSHVGDTGDMWVAQRHESATTSGCHQGHIGCHQVPMWVMLGSHMGAMVVTWVPPCVGATKVMFWWHQGHTWVPPSVGVTKVMFEEHWGHIWVSSWPCGCHQGHIWVPPRSHVGVTGDMWVPPHVGATMVTCGWHWGHVGGTEI